MTARTIKILRTAFTAASCVGVVGTGVASAKLAPKIKQAIDDTSDKSIFETVKAVSKVGWPIALIGGATIFSIAALNITNKKGELLVCSAFAALSTKHEKYREAANKIFGEDADERIQAEMASDVYVEHTSLFGAGYNSTDDTSDTVLFHDMTSDRWFYAKWSTVINAFMTVNRNINFKGDVSVSEWLSFLGLESHNDIYDSIVWDVEKIFEGYESYWLDFDTSEKIKDSTGERYFEIYPMMNPELITSYDS